MVHFNLQLPSDFSGIREIVVIRALLTLRK